MNSDKNLSARFGRAARHRKWAILLFPISGPLGELIESALNDNSFNIPMSAVYYFGIMLITIMFFVAKDEYKENND